MRPDDTFQRFERIFQRALDELEKACNERDKIEDRCRVL